MMDRRTDEATNEHDVVFDTQLLAGQTALITGAAANIGKALVIELAKHGASIIAVDIDETGLQELRDDVPDGTSLQNFVVDMGSQSDIDQLCDNLEAEGIVVDILVNNVGIHPDLKLTYTGDMDEWRRGFDINLFGPFRLTQNIARRLVELGRTGSIIFITSIHQWHIRRHPAYSSSKAAIGLAIKELADQFAEHGIRVNGIAPAATMEEVDDKPTVIGHVPLHGIAIPPEYVARNAVVLASNYFSRHTTGAVILIDSGLLARGFLTNLPYRRPE